jgi:hypothetical protein
MVGSSGAAAKPRRRGRQAARAVGTTTGTASRRSRKADANSPSASSSSSRPTKRGLVTRAVPAAVIHPVSCGGNRSAVESRRQLFLPPKTEAWATPISYTERSGVAEFDDSEPLRRSRSPPQDGAGALFGAAMDPPPASQAAGHVARSLRRLACTWDAASWPPASLSAWP